MGDGVDDWLILTAIQKSLIHYSDLKYKFLKLGAKECKNRDTRAIHVRVEIRTLAKSEKLLALDYTTPSCVLKF